MSVLNEGRKRVLIGSPIHQKPAILREFLASLLALKHDQFEINYFFIDDNEDPQSSELIENFLQTVPQVFIQYSNKADSYVRNETTHFWNEHLVWKVAAFKDSIIQYAIQLQYDYLFLVDSDLLLHPNTVGQLIAADKDIISEIFWTKWQPDAALQPQVWLRDEYTQWVQQRGEQLSDEELMARYRQFISQLEKPGIHEVGGLGACTLLSRHALTSGVSFKQISNLSFWGEDRHFCIRAAALGFQLYVDTHFPAYHIYRDSDLEGVDAFKQKNIHPPAAPKRKKLTLSMVVKNEGSRYLKQVLEEHRKYIDEAVIIDDGSTDNTVDICKEVLQGIPLRLITNTLSKFNNEIDLRKQQWQETIATEPDWILNLDADEMFETRFADEIQNLLQQTEFDLFCFRLYDFWSETQYREDSFWHSHFNYRPFLIHYRKDFDFKWKETPQHCGRFPENIFELPHTLSDLRLKHFGWANPEHRLEKYKRYMLLDPDAKYGWMEQYVSILDEHPQLITWIE